MNKAFLLKILKYTLGTILSLIILGVVIGGIAFAYFAATAPELSEDKLKAVNSSLVYDNQGNLIADLGTEKRESVTADSIPINLVNAIVSIEDKRFFEHRGIDIYRILGSAWHNLTNDTTQGGSTLDQQLIKLAYFSTASSDQTIKRKAQEAWLALQMERQYTKQEILTFYINKVYMGNGNYGMRTAAKAYFGLDLKDLSVAQLALLAGIPQAPSQYDPYTQPETSQARRDTVLGQMLNFGYINQDEYNAAVATPVTDGLLPLEQKLTFPKYLDNYLTEVVAEVQEQTGQDIFTAGLKVYTNVDIATQQYLWDVYNTDSYIYYPDADFQVASTIIDVNNGRVIAQLGGRNQDPNVSFGTNQAVLTDRDWGSTMKPISAYAPALETGAYTSTSQRTNDSYYTWPGTTTQLYNWDRQYYGWMTIQQAIMQSRNIPAVRALEAAGLTNAQNFLSGLGINYPEMVYANAISSNTSSADQQYGASSEKMAAAYAAFANGGTYYKPQYVNRIEFSDGTSQTFDNPGTRAMKETTAYMMTDMMKTVLNYGTGTKAAINGVFQAGKTGTSNYTEEELVTIEANTGLNPNYVGTMAPDENFVGYTPQYAMAVWTGYKNRLTPVYGYGLDIAAIVYRTMMLYLTGGYNEDFAMPDGLYRNGGYLYINGTQTYRNNPSSLYENLYNNTQQEITTAETTETTELQSSSELPTANHNLQTDNSSQANNEESDN